MSEDDSKKLVPPDGGWGWVIVSATCLIMFSYTSVTYCFGIVYVYLVEEGYSNTQVAIIPAIMNGISNLLGPLSTGLTSHYSHRRVVCTGIMLVTVGLLLCSFFNNLVWFYLCYGVIIGVGGALIKPQGILLGQLYFDKKRATANGFSMVGMSLSLMTLPAVISYLVQEYSYPGAFLLWSAIVLHGIIGASLYHPVKWHLKKEKPILQDDATSLQHKEQSKKSIAKDTHDANDECEKVSSSETKSQHGDSSDSEDDSELDRKNIRRSFIDPLNSPKLNLSKMESVKHSPTDNFEVITLERKFKKLHDEKRNSRGSIYSIASSIRGGYDVVDELGSCASFMDKNMMQKNSLSKTHEAKNNEGEQHCTCCCLKLPKIHNMIKLSLLKHPAFIISSFSSIFNRMVYICFITYLPAIAKEKDIGKLAPLLLTCIAVFELLAKIIMSVISDCGWMPRRYFYIIGSFLASIAIISVTATNGFWGLAICCCCYGFCIGTIMAVGNVLLVEYLGIKLLPLSFGLLLFMNGIAGIIFFTVTGLLNDVAGNYTVTYWAIGSVVTIPGFLWLSINCFNYEKPHELDSAE